MGALPGLFGLGSGAAGTSFAGPIKAPIAIGATTPEANTAYGQNQNALAQQQQLLTALQGQNGLGDQTSTYNQLQNIAAGKGPNPAQAMLNQRTGQDIANQAALMAGQRGAAGNVGLMARQAAQQGAATQQQAVGQGATMQAQQSLGALGQMGNMASTMAGNQIQQQNQNVQSQQAEQANILNALAGINSTQASMQSDVNNVNGQLANTQMQGQQGIMGNMMNTAGSMMGGMAMAGAEGGVVPAPAVDSSTPTFASDPAAAALAAGPQGGKQQQGKNQPQSSFGQFLKGKMGSGGALNQSETPSSTLGAYNPDSTPNYAGQDVTQMGGLNGSGALMAAKGGSTRDFRSGGSVKAANQAEKAVARGNSYANDKIPAVLSEGEVVIPRNVMQSGDPVQGAARFVHAVLAKKGKR